MHPSPAPAASAMCRCGCEVRSTRRRGHGQKRSGRALPGSSSLGSRSPRQIPAPALRGDRQGRAWEGEEERRTMPGVSQGAWRDESCIHPQVCLCLRPPSPRGAGKRTLRVSSKPLPQPAPVPIPIPVPKPVAAPRPTATSGLSRALAGAEPFTSPSGFLPSQGRFLHRPEMCEGVGRTGVRSQDHQHQEAVCSRWVLGVLLGGERGLHSREFLPTGARRDDAFDVRRGGGCLMGSGGTP